MPYTLTKLVDNTDLQCVQQPDNRIGIQINSPQPRVLGKETNFSFKLPNIKHGFSKNNYTDQQRSNYLEDATKDSNGNKSRGTNYTKEKIEEI